MSPVRLEFADYGARARHLPLLRTWRNIRRIYQEVQDSPPERSRAQRSWGLTQFLSTLPKHCLAKYPQVDMTRMPYLDRSYDLVVHSDTLEHIARPVAALAECYRVLAPGGYCVFTIPVIVGRMTRSREGLPPSYHGHPNQRSADFAVQTEYGCDAWKHLILAGFDECRLITPEYPSAFAFVGARWA